MAKPEETTSELSFIELVREKLTVCVLGTSPLIYNALSFKTKVALVYPDERKTAAERAQFMKHDPITEYRDSVYMNRGDTSPTRLLFPSSAFKKAMGTAALETPGAKKTQIGRLAWVEGENTAIYGVPRLYMAVVRMADMARTPDIRTRAILPTWCCEFTITYIKPALSSRSVGNLLATAGIIAGIGDGRQEKGTFSFGQFAIVRPDDERFVALVKNAGREAQDRALKNPAMHDEETERLFARYNEKLVSRGEERTTRGAARVGKTNGKTEEVRT